jgi:hypothetical protein
LNPLHGFLKCVQKGWQCNFDFWINYENIKLNHHLFSYHPVIFMPESTGRTGVP